MVEVSLVPVKVTVEEPGVTVMPVKLISPVTVLAHEPRLNWCGFVVPVTPASDVKLAVVPRVSLPSLMVDGFPSVIDPQVSAPVMVRPT